MSREIIQKTTSGLVIMIVVFLLFASSTRPSLLKSGATSLLQGTNSASEASLAKPSLPQNIVKGTFDATGDGDFVIEDENKELGEKNIYHYRAIKNKRLKTAINAPVLKLEIRDDDQRKWEKIQIAQLDKKEGSLYFLLKTETNNSVSAESFTGSYQLIFE